MTRLTFWIINLTGAYLILTRDREESFNMRLLLGIALMAVGTLGILLMHLFPRWRAKSKEEDGR